MKYRVNCFGNQQGVTEDLVVHLETYHGDPFSPRAKAALRLAELLALEPHRLDEAFGDELSHHFTPGQIVQLRTAIAFLCGLDCFVAAFRIPL